MLSWVLWAILSALFAAGTALLAKVGVEAIDSNLATAIRTSVVLVLCWALVLATHAHRGLPEIGRRSWLFLALSGICTGLSWLCYFRALKLGPVSGVAPIDKLSVALVVVAGWLLFGEGMTPTKALGAGLVTAVALVLAFA